MDKKEEQNLHRELEAYEYNGIPLLLNGKKATASHIEQAYRIAEEGEYMRDYIQDEDGKIQGLSFDLVRE